jgi:hypothetical protein
LLNASRDRDVEMIEIPSMYFSHHGNLLLPMFASLDPAPTVSARGSFWFSGSRFSRFLVFGVFVIVWMNKPMWQTQFVFCFFVDWD